MSKLTHPLQSPVGRALLQMEISQQELQESLLGNKRQAMPVRQAKPAPFVKGTAKPLARQFETGAIDPAPAQSLTGKENRMVRSALAAFAAYFAALFAYVAVAETLSEGSAIHLFVFMSGYGGLWLHGGIWLALSTLFYYRGTAILSAINRFTGWCGAGLTRAAKLVAFKAGTALVNASRN